LPEKVSTVSPNKRYAKSKDKNFDYYKDKFGFKEKEFDSE